VAPWLAFLCDVCVLCITQPHTYALHGPAVVHRVPSSPVALLLCALHTLHHSQRVLCWRCTLTHIRQGMGGGGGGWSAAPCPAPRVVAVGVAPPPPPPPRPGGGGGGAPPRSSAPCPSHRELALLVRCGRARVRVRTHNTRS
jgi:hypothetical protein